MARYDSRWLQAHAGPTTPRRMSAALRRISRAVGREPEKLAVSRISRRADPFHVLVACLISLRTKDEVTDVAAPRLLEVAPTPAQMARLPARRIEKLIYPAGFYRNKARTLREVSAKLVAEYDGQVPADLDEMLKLKGVGRKTANLVLTLGHGKPGICVDTHVHRISNRLGFVKTAGPDDTERVLRHRLPARWWIPINDLLVAYGRRVCTPLSPRCSECVVSNLCPRTGVGRTR